MPKMKLPDGCHINDYGKILDANRECTICINGKSLEFTVNGNGNWYTRSVSPDALHYAIRSANLDPVYEMARKLVFAKALWEEAERLSELRKLIESLEDPE
jgi:hypothetical protein